MAVLPVGISAAGVGLELGPRRVAWAESKDSLADSIVGVDATFPIDRLKIRPTASDHIMRTVTCCLYRLPEPIRMIRREVTRFLPRMKEEQLARLVSWIITPGSHRYIREQKRGRAGFHSMQFISNLGVVINIAKLTTAGGSKKLINSILIPVREDPVTNHLVVGKAVPAIEYRIQETARSPTPITPEPPSLKHEWENIRRIGAHPHLFTDVYGCWYRDAAMEKESMLVRKVKDESLFLFLDKRHSSSKEVARKAILYLHQIGLAISHLHSKGFIHRDIKPENILLDGDRAMLADSHEIISEAEWIEELEKVYVDANRYMIQIWDEQHCADRTRYPLTGKERLERLHANRSYREIVKNFQERFSLGKKVAYPSRAFMEDSLAKIWLITMGEAKRDFLDVVSLVDAKVGFKLRGTDLYCSEMAISHQFQSVHTDVYAFLATIQHVINRLNERYPLVDTPFDEHNVYVQTLNRQLFMSSRCHKVDMEGILDVLSGLYKSIR